MSTYHPYLQKFARKKLLLHVSTQVSQVKVLNFRYDKIEGTGYRNTIRLTEQIFDIVQKETKKLKHARYLYLSSFRVLSR